MTKDEKTRILPSLAEVKVGTQLSGIYELDDRIASGGMGEVYRGHNIQTGDHVAIKIVLPEFARDETILQLFRKEARVLGALSHDAIVRYHVFTIDAGIGRPYLAMEFVNGQSLFDWLRKNGAMAADDVRRLCHRVASGLSAAHEAGTIHRDLSPDNIILPGSKVERAKIIDFGIARSANVGGETLIGGRFAGKYNYVSPEQLGLFSGEVTEQSDIYSLGLVLAAALRGKPLDMSGSQFEVIEKRRAVPDLSQVDADLKPLVEAMLQPDPHDRPASMADIARATQTVSSRFEPTYAPRRDISAPPLTFRQATENAQAKRADEDTPTQRLVGEPFVQHVRPAHLSQPRPPQQAVQPPPVKSGNAGKIALAAAALLAVAGGAGAYMTGLISFRDPDAEQQRTAALTPDTTVRPQAEAPSGEPADAPPADPPAVAQPPATPSTDAQPVAPPPIAAPPVVATPPVSTSSNNQPNTPPDQPAQPPTADVQPPVAVAPVVDPPVIDPPASDPGATATNPATPPRTEQPQTAAPASGSQQPDTTTAQPPAADNPPANQGIAGDSNQAGSTDIAQDQPRTPEAPVVAPPAGEQTPTESGPPTAGNDVLPGGDVAEQPDTEEQIALNIPTITPPPVTPPVAPPHVTPPPDVAIDNVATRISWLHQYSGGDCFYATATSATDRAIDIEGFGTSVEPFSQLLEAFQTRFSIEPDVSVRLIDPAQCEVTKFLRQLGDAPVDKPDLQLDQTSVPNGSPVSGTLETKGGLKSNLMLIDHKGMAFSLDQRIRVADGKASFSIPIGLSSADQAAGVKVPQIIVVVTAPSDIVAADFSKPTPANVLLPSILSEIRKRGLEGSATAKFFRLGG